MGLARASPATLMASGDTFQHSHDQQPSALVGNSRRVKWVQCPSIRFNWPVEDGVDEAVYGRHEQMGWLSCRIQFKPANRHIYHHLYPCWSIPQVSHPSHPSPTASSTANDLPLCPHSPQSRHCLRSGGSPSRGRDRGYLPLVANQIAWWRALDQALASQSHLWLFGMKPVFVRFMFVADKNDAPLLANSSANPLLPS